MQRSLATALFVAALTSVALGPTPTFAEDGPWRQLLAKDLSQDWELWMGIAHKSVTVPGYPASTSEDCMTGDPIGLVDVNNDPLKLVTMTEEEGVPVLRISGQIYAGLTTKESFKNYHLSLETKWGEKKWPPRLNMKRDSGLLLHCTGKHGAFWGVWMADVECQIQEGDCGDLFLLGGASARVRVLPTAPGERYPRYSVSSTTIHNGNTHHSASKEKPNGEWNTIEAYVLEDKMVFLVNGDPVMAAHNTQYRGARLAEGKIQIQSEAAEVYYRNLKLRPITAFPEDLAEHVRPIAKTN